jgi:hypothetical protein
MKMIRSYWRERITQTAAMALVAGLMSSCSDDPSALNSVGTQLLRTKVTVRTDTLRSISSSSQRQYVSMDGRTNLLGRSGGYTAYTLVQFYPAFFAQRDTVQVLSASLSLRAVTWFGDSSAQFGFNAYEINRSWGQTTFTWDSLTGLNNSTPSSETYSGTVARDTEWINIQLDTAMVRRWLQPLTISTNYGLILIPTPNTNVVRGFHSFDFDSVSFYPKLTVIARNVAGTVTDTTSYQAFGQGQDTFVGNIDNLNTNPELIYAQSGVSYRGFLKFDLSAIPRGAIINSAELTLKLSPATSRLNKFLSDTAIAAHSVLSATDNSKFEAQGSRGTGNWPNGINFVFPDLRRQAQYWIRDVSLNNGLLFRTVNQSEFSSFDLFTFYNQTAQDSTMRPQLIVKYTVESN